MLFLVSHMGDVATAAVSVGILYPGVVSFKIYDTLCWSGFALTWSKRLRALLPESSSPLFPAAIRIAFVSAPVRFRIHQIWDRCGYAPPGSPIQKQVLSESLVKWDF